MCIQNCDNIKICDSNGSHHHHQHQQHHHHHRDAQDIVAVVEVVEGGENNVIHTSDPHYENFKSKLQLQSELNRKRQRSVKVKAPKLSNFKILMCCCYFIVIVMMI
ncbi:GL26056 [Drosophila persimilis]|uniref:GL26056 n=1 Tax=Drosophila persimilis TaxID=7234 RepID=B4GKC8_DROPE|nr:uncharacterized protein LOC6593719 [Drosophila persimilis]XP_026843031.1 uncharacterized protein LOC6593719 [Drosophila persimilis]XP_026843033.1 uncharacterized protein LOC6593719 [Drosophila persimilis]EDW37094.1 GL26056 [Drosophila persimilis]